MLGIRCPDRHALSHINRAKHTTLTVAYSRASGFVHRRKGVVQQAAMPVRLPTHTRPVISARFACRFAHGGQAPQ
jgi:hypothetical protein